MKIPKIIVLDSWAIMAFLEDEPAGERVADLIADAAEQGSAVLMSVINVGEVWYSTARRRSVRDADQALRWLKEMGIEIIDADMKLTQIAAQFKAKGGIAYADCFAAALAKVHSSPPARAISGSTPARGGVAPASGGEVVGAGRGGGSVLITGDREFKQLDNEVSIVWL